MNQKQINAFRMVMRHGSVTAAANALNVSQPAVSRLLSDLEASIGLRLLLRPGGKVQPTQEAYEFFEEVERMYYGLDRLAQVADDIRNLRRATFRVASLPMVSFEIVPRAVKRYLDLHPGVSVMHDVHTSSQVLDLLTSRQIDLGIAQTSSQRRDVDVLAAFRTDCVCAMQPGHPLADRDVLTPHDLADEPLVVLNFRTLTYCYMVRCFAEAGITPHVVTETQPSYSACGLAALGTGIAIVDPITPGTFGAALRTVPFEPSLPYEFQIMKPVDVPLSRAAAAFLDQLLSTIAEQPHYGQRTS
ncbi:LysR substrate-binding domain-containing protein [Tropicimonas sp.]|uniref:LysR substrate-binding domain-containing protein n=1 Tax=Tropicimonas sp. TaxID=2067044 RepID=UPI003A8747A5